MFRKHCQILRKYCHKYFPSIIQILSIYCPTKYYPNILQIMSQATTIFCPKIVQIYHKYCLNIAQILSKYYPNIIQILSRYYPDIFQMISRYFPYIVQNNVYTLSKCCTTYFLNVIKIFHKTLPIYCPSIV